MLPNVWDAASAKAVVAAGFPVVATTSAGIAVSLGYEDHQGAPAAEMFEAAARIGKSVDVPLTVDAEAGYGMTAGGLVDALLEIGAAGCNLEDTDHAKGSLVDTSRQAEWLAAVRQAADERDYRLVINARVDVLIADHGAHPQRELLDEAVSRARAYCAAGADCVFPIILSEAEAIAEFIEAVQAPVNILALPQAPPIAQLAELGVARVSYGSLLHHHTMRQLTAFLTDQISG